MITVKLKKGLLCQKIRFIWFIRNTHVVSYFFFFALSKKKKKKKKEQPKEKKEVLNTA